MAAKTTLKDWTLASALTLVGVALVLVALRMRWNPHELNPGIEGCLTVGVVGFLFALLHPLEYRHAVLVSAPVVAVQVGACLAVGGPAAGVVGIELIIFGLTGLGMGFFRSRPAPVAEGDSVSRSRVVLGEQVTAPRAADGLAGGRDRAGKGRRDPVDQRRAWSSVSVDGAK